ncbi:hypothetical protein K466DRAFT_59313 [Polyporus arcularius HHB13444]|uniref:Uncharacterized protein n=1 Tax=Polyporus arcularius HHB13444 TaxID=1314778 RepID=A0A5C3PVX9_9APHY|nr:hypothetical protein K466DRAFT_59313 [Polyporus arcularius HHB13444]
MRIGFAKDSSYNMIRVTVPQAAIRSTSFQYKAPRPAPGLQVGQPDPSRSQVCSVQYWEGISFYILSTRYLHE